MELSHIIWLALVQGLTEFLPVSSSAHLILVPKLLAWEDQGLAFDVAVHLGTLIAVVAYFRHDIVTLFIAWVGSLPGVGGQAGKSTASVHADPAADLAIDPAIDSAANPAADVAANSPANSPADSTANSTANSIADSAANAAADVSTVSSPAMSSPAVSSPVASSSANVGMSPEARLAWGVIVGTIPAGLVGLFFMDVIAEHLRSPLVIATTTVAFGLLLWFADRRAQLVRTEQTLGWQDFLVVGGAQALALIPGTSRSGITITAGLLLGLTREAAARYSFLLSIPIIVLSGLGVTRDLIASDAPADWMALAIGTVVAAISAFICIKLFLAFINRIGMGPFVLYRLALGALLVWVFV